MFIHKLAFHTRNPWPKAAAPQIRWPTRPLDEPDKDRSVRVCRPRDRCKRPHFWTLCQNWCLFLIVQERLLTHPIGVRVARHTNGELDVTGARQTGQSNAEFFAQRSFSQRIGFGERPPLIIIDMVRASTDETAPLGADLLEICRRRRGRGSSLEKLGHNSAVSI